MDVESASDQKQGAMVGLKGDSSSTSFRILQTIFMGLQDREKTVTYSYDNT
jgi:hypothetical protein